MTEEMSIEEVHEYLMKGFEDFSVEAPYRIRDTEDNYHRIDVAENGTFSDEQYSRAKEWMERWCEFEGREVFDIKPYSGNGDGVVDYLFYFSPPFESYEEKIQSQSNIFGKQVG